jgi:hypothetical protein
MKKVALLIDGGWFCKALSKLLNCAGGWPTADQLYRNATAAVKADEEILRIFYYDCEPDGNKAENPIDKSVFAYGQSPAFRARKAFFHELSQRNVVALRRGELKARGWQLQPGYKEALLNGRPGDAAPGGGHLFESATEGRGQADWDRCGDPRHQEASRADHLVFRRYRHDPSHEAGSARGRASLPGQRVEPLSLETAPQLGGGQ